MSNNTQTINQKVMSNKTKNQNLSCPHCQDTGLTNYPLKYNYYEDYCTCSIGQDAQSAEQAKQLTKENLGIK